MTRELLIDVSDLEPPDPLILTLEAAEALEPGTYLRMRHRRDPCLLYENLRSRGFVWRHAANAEAMIELLIWRGDDAEAAAAVDDADLKSRA